MTLLSEEGAHELGIDETDARRHWSSLGISRLELIPGAPETRRFERGLLFLPVKLQVELRRTGSFLGGAPSYQVEHAFWFALAPNGSLSGCSESPAAMALPAQITCEKTLRPNHMWYTAHDAHRANAKDVTFVDYDDIPSDARMVGLRDGDLSWNFSRFSEAECTGNRLPDANYEAHVGGFYVCPATTAVQPLKAGELPVNASNYFGSWQNHQVSRIQGPGVMWHWLWNNNCLSYDTAVKIKVHYTLHL
jgi:hypothetical protein